MRWDGMGWDGMGCILTLLSYFTLTRRRKEKADRSAFKKVTRHQNARTSA